MNNKSKNSVATVAGIAAATMATGAAIYLVNENTSKSKKKAMKKNTQKAMKNVGTAVSNVVDTMATNLLK